MSSADTFINLAKVPDDLVRRHVTVTYGVANKLSPPQCYPTQS